VDFSQFVPAFGSLAFTLVAFIVALSIIVAIHEYGHYIVGRWTGIKAEVFSLGFGPVLFSRVDRHGTRWQVAALPLGGYVKFLGDSNAASVGGSTKSIPASQRRNTMLGAPVWARALTVAAGPFANFLLTILIFTVLTMSQGRATDPLTVGSLRTLPESFAQDLQPGDEILSIDGRAVTVETLTQVAAELPHEPALSYRVRRDGQEVEALGPNPMPPAVGGVSPNSAALDIGLRPDDVVLSVDGQPVYAFDQLVTAVTGSGGRPLTFEVWRAGEILDVTLVPRRSDQPLPEGGFETRWLVGLAPALAFEPETESPGLLVAVWDSVQGLWRVITTTISALMHMVAGEISTCNLSGPIGIAEATGAMASQGFLNFVNTVAMLSAAVGLMNLFPIPILDGGHLVFHAYEAVTRRPPSDRALRVLMAAGLSVLLTMMLWAVANDTFLCP
jgi:regulator of sigma E protease